MSKEKSSQVKRRQTANAKAQRIASKVQRKATEPKKREKRSHETAHEFH